MSAPNREEREQEADEMKNEQDQDTRGGPIVIDGGTGALITPDDPTDDVEVTAEPMPSAAAVAAGDGPATELGTEVAVRPRSTPAPVRPAPVRLWTARERTPLDPDAPLLPTWLSNRGTFEAAARMTGRRAWWRTRWLGVWIVPAMLALIVRSPVGVGRLLGLARVYLYDAHSASLRSALRPDGSRLSKEDAESFTKIQKERRANLRARWGVAGGLVLLLLGPVLALYAPRALGVLLALAVIAGALVIGTIEKTPGFYLLSGVLLGVGVYLATPVVVARYIPPDAVPSWLGPALLFVLLLVLGWIGRPLDRPLVMSAAAGTAPPPQITPDLIMDALVTLGDSRMKERESIRYLPPGLHRYGPGIQAEFELPPGVSATFVMQRREAFASAIRRELACVWPSVGARHPGHLVVFVSDEPTSKARQPAWPLMKSGAVDIFHPIPAFTDQRGTWVEITLIYANMIIGAVPRMGKTFVLRMLLLCCALDVRVKIAALDGKGTGDLAPLSLVAEFYSVGDEPDEMDRVVEFFRKLRQEMRRRARVVRDLPHDVYPENKVTAELASRKDLGLEPWVVGIDETQAYFEYGDKNDKCDKRAREELAAIISDLVKRGPALGIIVVLATQNVNANTIPTSISNNAVMRFCLKMLNYDTNDRVLGTGAFKRGIDATMFDISDKGMGYLVADGAEARIARSVFGLDAVASEKVARRARALRVEAGRLGGDADDEESAAEAAQVDLLADARDAMGTAPRMHLTALREAMALAWPDRYGHVDAVALGSALRAAGARTGQVSVGGTNTTGVRREWLDVSATANVESEERADDGPAEDDGDGDQAANVVPLRR